MLEIVCDLIQFAVDHGILVILENPQLSRVFLTTRMKDLINNNNGVVNVADYCQYDKKWKKPTSFVVWNSGMGLSSI